MFRIKPNDHHCGITRSGNYIPATVGFLDPPERLFNLKGEMTYDVPCLLYTSDAADEL